MDRSDGIGTVDSLLAHYGVKGMRWGVRRPEGSGPVAVTTRETPGRKVRASGGQGHKPSEDAVRATVLKQRAKKSSVHSLSNKDLQDLVTRMNLEKQYSTLKGDNAFKKGVQITRDLVGAGKLGKEIFDIGRKVVRK